MRNIAVTMTRGMYQSLLMGRNASDGFPSIRGCQTREGVIQYLNDLHLFLGHVVDIVVED